MKKAILLFFLCLPSIQLLAQNGVMINYGLGGKDDSAILELKSADQGFLAPKIALTSTTATTPIYNNTPAIGLIVYNTATVSDVVPGYYYWDGAKWTRLLNGASAPPTGSGTQNYVTKWNNAAGTTLGNSQIFDNGTSVAIGNTVTTHKLSVGDASSDAQSVTIRGYSNTPTSWKGGAAFGYTGASVIMGELNGVAQIGGHSPTLNAWANLALNSSGGNVGIGTSSPASKLSVVGQTILSRDNTTQCCAGVDEYTLAIAENSNVTARKSAIQFHNSGESEAYFRLNGTGTGSRRFEIGDNQAVGTALQISSLSGTGNRAVYADANGKLVSSATAGIISGSGTTNYLARWTPDGSTLGIGVTYDNGTNVGIGTTSPLGKLEVNQDNTIDAVSGSNVGSIHLTHPTSGSAGVSAITFKSTVNWPSDGGYLAYYDDNNSYNYWGDSNENSALILGTTNDGQNASSDVVVLKSQAAVIADAPSFLVPSGNVGIGTTAPAYRLDLASGTFGFGNGNARTETRDNAGLQGNAGAQSGMFETSAPTNYYAGATGWQHMLDVRHSNAGNNYAMQFAGSFYDQNLWFRKTNNNPAQAWSRILTTTDIPGGVLPTGSLGQTLYHNGSNWVAGSNLSNDGSTINLGSFTTADADEWPKVTWLRTGTWDEGLIKGNSTRGAWGRTGFGIHMDASKHFGFFSSGWEALFDIEGGTGRAYHKGSVGIGATNPLDNLFIAGTNNNGTDVLNNDGNDRPGLSIRGEYPEINLISSQGTNAQHGATLRFVAYDNNTTRDTWKHWVVGVPGVDAYFLDFGYRANTTNPHEGISGYAGATVMRMTNNGNVGIGNFGTYGTVGLTQPASTLHVMGKANIHQSGAAGGQNRFEGIDAPTSANGRAQLVLSSAFSDLVIASSNVNDNHGSTLTFATYNPGDANDYRKFVINQGNWGNRKGYLDFGFADAGGRSNPHTNINGTDVVQTLDGINKRVGIGTMNPAAKLHVYNVYPFVGGTDGMLKIKSVTGPCCGTETVALQTTIDDRTDDYVISGYGGDSRHVLSLQPDGGFVGVGTNVAADKLHVQTGNIRLSQPAATNTGKIVYQSSQETNADWRLWNLDDFESGNDGWSAYQSITSGTTTTFSRNDPSIYGTSAFLNYYNLGNGGATVFKKGFAIPASESGWVKIKLTYHLIDSWDGEYAYIGVANAVTANPTILWSRTHSGGDKPPYSYFGGSWSDSFETVEAVVENNFTGTMWLVVGSGLNQGSTDESFGIDDVEIWVK